MTSIDESTTGRDERAAAQGDAGFSRRTMLRGATVGGLALPLLAACGGSDDSTSGPSASGDSSSAAASSAAPDAPAASGATVAASAVPVGGGTILKDAKVVVTQPTKGDFKAFTAVCTHKGCTVAKVEDEKIMCPCHGSMFSISDGAPVGGPAPAPLAAKTATLKAGEITVT